MKAEELKHLKELALDIRANSVFTSWSCKNVEELKRQITNFAEHISEAGNVSYYSVGQEHDDTVMALMLACFIGRAYVKNQDGFMQQQTIVSKKHTYDEEDVYGSGIPLYSTSLGREVRYP